MSVWVGLLRGINVGRSRKVEMARLRQVCEAAGLSSVRTYINSGNVIFSSGRRSGAALRDLLEPPIAQEFGFPVPVVVRTPGQLADVLAGLPFPDAEQVSVSFLSRALDAGTVEALQSALVNDAELVVDGDHAYLRTPHGLGQPFLTGRPGRDFGAVGTVRNWRTVTTLEQLAREHSG